MVSVHGGFPAVRGEKWTTPKTNTGMEKGKGFPSAMGEEKKKRKKVKAS